jgi:heme exporter protein A
MCDISVQIEGLTVDYGARRVLDGITLHLAAGETLVVAGANGSGKSSLLRVLCGLQRPTRGSVSYLLGGVRYRPEQARGLVGWLAPELQLYRELTAIENLRFFARVRGLQLGDAELQQRLAEVGLEGRGHDLLAAYSSGMTQRLRYAFALLHQPPVLLLDEPTITFDERGVAIFEQIARRQRERGILVIATNDAREERLGDYVLRLAAG